MEKICGEAGIEIRAGEVRTSSFDDRISPAGWPRPSLGARGPRPLAIAHRGAGAASGGPASPPRPRPLCRDALGEGKVSHDRSGGALALGVQLRRLGVDASV